VFRRGELVAELVGDGFRGGEHAQEWAGERGLRNGAARRRGQLFDSSDGARVDALRGGAGGFEQGADSVVGREQ